MAVWWRHGSGIEDLGDVPGGDEDGHARGVSGDGAVVVGYGAYSHLYEPFRWTGATGLKGLGLLPGGDDGRAFGISEDGSIIVGGSTSAYFQPEPFRWTAAGGMERLGPDYQAGQAFDVTPNGEFIVGQASGGGFRWSESAGYEFFGTGAAYGVSANGRVVVGGGGSPSKAWVWDPVNGVQNLRQLLYANGAWEVQDWALTVALDVSACGRWVVGGGLGPGQFYDQPWIAMIPRVPYPGDMNCDDSVDFGDINRVVLALTDPVGYPLQFPDCNSLNGDTNLDERVDFGDINPFVGLLTE